LSSTSLTTGRWPTIIQPTVLGENKYGVLVYLIRGTIGGDKVNYDGDTAAYTALMQVIKLMSGVIKMASGVV
jgi:hypothetical protein